VKETGFGIGRGQKGRSTQGQDGTHGRIGEVRMVLTIILLQPIGATAISQPERGILSCRVEVSSVGDWGSSDFTAWRRQGTAVPFLDDPQSGGGYDRGVVCFYNPRFVPLHTNCGVATDQVLRPWRRLVHVYRETAGRRESGFGSDEDCLNDRPSSRVLVTIREGLEGNAVTVVRRFHCRAWVGAKNGRGVEDNSLT